MTDKIEIPKEDLQTLIDNSGPHFDKMKIALQEAGDAKFDKVLKCTETLYTDAWNFFVDEGLSEKELAILVQNYVGTAITLLINDFS